MPYPVICARDGDDQHLICREPKLLVHRGVRVSSPTLEVLYLRRIRSKVYTVIDSATIAALICFHCVCEMHMLLRITGYRVPYLETQVKAIDAVLRYGVPRNSS